MVDFLAAETKAGQPEDRSRGPRRFFFKTVSRLRTRKQANRIGQIRNAIQTGTNDCRVLARYIEARGKRSVAFSVTFHLRSGIGQAAIGRQTPVRNCRGIQPVEAQSCRPGVEICFTV
ncbi:hypothetical protein D3C87_1613010 [compost metagenome]